MSSPLFSKNSIAALKTFTESGVLFAFDYDGTLSKIFRNVSDDTLLQSTSFLLKELARQAPVAIISGRGLKDLRKRISCKPKYLVGNHGLEGIKKNASKLTSARAQCKKWKKILEKSGFPKGVEIEDKLYTIAIHYRLTANLKEARKQIESIVAKLSPRPRVVAGKSIFNLLPDFGHSQGPNKGSALLELMKIAKVKKAIYFGDDDTDEDVFRLRERAAIVGVRVGKKKSSSAAFYMSRQSQINRVLRTLIAFSKNL